MSGGFFRGTSADQDTRFSNKQAKLLKTQKFAPELEHLVDTSKVEMDVMKPWIANRVTELLGFEDEVLINFIYGLLEAKEVNGKEVQIQLTGFMEKHTSRFMKELWGLLLSAQQNASGVPQQFLDAKEEEARKRKEESDRIVNEIQKRKEKEHKEHELEKSKKMDGGAGSDEDMEPNSKHLSRGSGRHSENRKGGSRNGFRRRSRESRSPNSGSSTPPHRDASRSRSRSVSKSRSYSKEGKKSRSTSASPSAKNRSSSSPRMHQSPRKRSSTPRRRTSPGQSMLPRRRRGFVSRPGSPSPSRRRVRSPVRRPSPSPVSRSPSPSHGKRSHSLSRRRSPSPFRCRSRSPRRRLCRSPRRCRSPSPVRRRRRSPFSPRYRRRSPTPVRRRPSSPARRRSPSPAGRRSPSPSRRRYSPGERRYRSPAARRYRSPAAHRRSPLRLRSLSPARHRSPSPARHRSRSSQRRSPSPIQSDSASPVREKSVSSLDRRSLSPVQHRSASPVRGRSPVSSRKKSLSPLQSRSPSPDYSIPPAPIRRISSSPGRRRSPTLQRSLVVPSKGRDSPHESPMKGDKRMTASGSKNPPPKSRDLKGRNENVGINEADEAEHVRDGQGSRDIPSLINPVQSRLQEGRSDLREDTDLRKRDKGRSEDTSSKAIPAPSKSQYKRISSVERSKMMHHGEESRADGKRNLSKDVDYNILLDKDKPGNTLKLNNKDEREKPGSDGSAKHRGDISEKKKKHKLSSRKDVSSDESSYDSDLEERKEIKKKRKEEKRLRKEERRRHREERRRRKEEKRANKRKRKSRDSDSEPSDLEKNGNGTDDGRAVRRKHHSSGNEDTESEKKRLEIELREKALQSLLAKKGINH